MFGRKRKEVWSDPGPWLPSHRALVVLWLSSFLILGVTLFLLAGVDLFGLLGVSLIFRVFVQEGLTS